MNTGCSRRVRSASSSAIVGKRIGCGARKNWVRPKPPTEVIHSPGCTSLARATSVASASAIEFAFSRRVSRPGRRPSRMMWLWLSMIPGTAVRPRRSIVRVHSSSLCSWWPTSAKCPLVMSTLETTLSCLSIVWIRPFTRRSEVLPSQSFSARAAVAPTQSASAAAPTHACCKFNFIVSSGIRDTELPIWIVRWRLGAREQHAARAVAVDAIALALEQRAPVAFRVLHRAEGAVGVQRDAGAIGLGDDEPGTRRLRHGGARAVEDVHQRRLHGNELRLARDKNPLDRRDELRIDGARHARLAAPPFARAEEPRFGTLAVDLGEVVAQVGLLFRRRGKRAAPGHERIAHEMVRQHHRRARAWEFDALQRLERAVPRLAAECRVARIALRAHGDLGRRQPDDEALRKQR